MGAVSLASCGRNDRPATVEEYTGRSFWTKNAVMSTLSSDASYRSAYIILGGGADRGDNVTNGDRYPGQFCPEPPPDVSQSVSAAVTAAINANVSAPGALLGPASTTGTATAGVGANYGEALATAVAPLIQRTQGLQFYRDQAFYICAAYLNGVLDSATYLAELDQSAELAAQVIMLEIVKGGIGDEPTDLAKVEADLKKSVEALGPIREILKELTPPAASSSVGIPKE
jgi:hypothetical protein